MEEEEEKNLVMTFAGYEWLLTFKVEFEVKLIHLKITLKYEKPKHKKS